MSTQERELREPVDLALANGRLLNPEARGWSRSPLHRANLRGAWGRTKRWDYWAILAGNLVAQWRERDGTPAALDATVELPPGHESLNVVIPWSERRFQYTSKHQARPARGELEVGKRRWRFGHAENEQEAWGVLDVGRGRWPYRTRWNWGGGAGRAGPHGPVVGLQLGGIWTEGSGFTENGVLLDGRLSKLGCELRWDYDWADPMRPWRVEDPAGRLRLELTPRYDKHTRLEFGILGSETHQVFGTWTGTFIADDGGSIDFAALQGFAEESRSRW